MDRFPTKRDGWAVGLLGLVVVMEAAVAVFFWRVPLALPMKLAITLLCLATAGFCLSILLSTYYEVRADALLVRHGPLRWRIPLDAIRDVQPSHNLVSSAALSRDRLRVRYGRYAEIFISPADRSGFLHRLAARAPQLELRGDSLVPRERRDI